MIYLGHQLDSNNLSLYKKKHKHSYPAPTPYPGDVYVILPGVCCMDAAGLNMEGCEVLGNMDGKPPDLKNIIEKKGVKQIGHVCTPELVTIAVRV